MECLGHILAVQPVSDIMRSLEEIVSPHIMFLAELTATQVHVRVDCDKAFKIKFKLDTQRTRLSWFTMYLFFTRYDVICYRFIMVRAKFRTWCCII